MSAGRETYTSLKTHFGDLIGQPGFTDATLGSFFDRSLGQRYQLILAELPNHKTQPPPQTASTVADQQYYHNPPGVSNVEAVTVTVGSLVIPLTVVNSQVEWDRLNEVSISGAYPQHYFPRRDDFGIWPIPGGVYTLTVNYHLRDRSLTTADYTTGTCSVTNNSQTVTGSGTTWTSAMVGRWFKFNTNGYWYRVSAFTSTTEITLESVYEGPTAAGGTYLIGESPEIPEEGHICLVDGVTADYYSGPRKDRDQSTWFENKFWTGDGKNFQRDIKTAVGGVLGLKRRYASRSDSRLIKRRRKSTPSLTDKLFATTLS